MQDAAETPDVTSESPLPQRTHTRTRKRHKQNADATFSEPAAAQSPTPLPPPADHWLHVPSYRSAAVAGYDFEYLDHTADVQLHAWGGTLKAAFENVALAMYNYMTPIRAIDIDEDATRTFDAKGHDLHSLLFNFLDELLFVFSTELLVCREISITRFEREPREGEHTDAFAITAVGRGEKFDRRRHEVGTEIKAITYSAMQIREDVGDAEVFVIVDI